MEFIVAWLIFALVAGIIASAKGSPQRHTITR